jgi:HSP20 family protein
MEGVMSLIKFIPWRPATPLNGLFDDFFTTPFKEEEGFFNPVVDIYDNDTSIVINADLPGVKKEEISVDFHNGLLTIKALRSDEKEVTEKNFYKKERATGVFKRSFTLPDTVNPDTIKAEFKDGVLKIEVEKPEETKAKQINVK